MNHFIKMPDGTIINVANITHLEHAVSDMPHIEQAVTILYFYQEHRTVRDPNGAVYAYFESIAQEL